MGWGILFCGGRRREGVCIVLCVETFFNVRGGVEVFQATSSREDEHNREKYAYGYLTDRSNMFFAFA